MEERRGGGHRTMTCSYCQKKHMVAVVVTVVATILEPTPVVALTENTAAYIPLHAFAEGH